MPLCFQAGCRKRRLNLSLVFLCLFCVVVHFFCCVLFSFFHTRPRDWLDETSPKWPVLCRVGSKTTTHSISPMMDNPPSPLNDASVESVPQLINCIVLLLIICCNNDGGRCEWGGDGPERWSVGIVADRSPNDWQSSFATERRQRRDYATVISLRRRWLRCWLHTSSTRQRQVSVKCTFPVRNVDRVLISLP